MQPDNVLEQRQQEIEGPMEETSSMSSRERKKAGAVEAISLMPKLLDACRWGDGNAAEQASDFLSRQSNPVERLASEQQQLKTHSGWFAEITKRSELFLKTGKRIVALECGHYVLSRSLHRAACPRCGEMIRSGYDHDGFRRLGMSDEFHWPGDPLLELNEGGARNVHGTIARSGLV